MHSYESRQIAAAEVLRVTGFLPTAWDCSMAEVCGIGDEYFFTLKSDSNRFVYLCIEDGVITSCETP